MDQANVRIRPLRLAFAVRPTNVELLMRILEANSAFWGGPYNFILPLFKRVPKRYIGPYRRSITTRALIEGLVEAFQPDFIVEMESDSLGEIEFPRGRVISYNHLLSRDQTGRCAYGVDLRSIITKLYEKTFRFVQRHPPEAIIPHCSDSRYDLLFAAIFGALPTAGPIADCSDAFLRALDGQRRSYKPEEFSTLFDRKFLFPLRVASHGLETTEHNFSIDSKLYYLDEGSPLDIIEYWNLRALGWHITPLPASLAPAMVEFCERFIEQNHWPYPSPSNAYHGSSFLCSPSNTEAALRAFMSTLRKPSSLSSDVAAVSIDMRVPRIWEEWGRSADHARPQTVTESTALVECHLIGNGLHVRTAIPEFLEDDRYSSSQHACVNVYESIPGGAQVIPWGSGELTGLIENFADERMWVSPEGIVTTSAQFATMKFLQAPNALNVFSAFMRSRGLVLALSQAGNICNQIIKALGGLQSNAYVVRTPEFLRFLNSLAHESVEIDFDNSSPKKLRKPFAPYAKALEAINRATAGGPDIAKSNFFKHLVDDDRVLSIGLTLRCEECNHTSWHGLTSLGPKMSCPRCAAGVGFPAALPPQKEDWAYKVRGPFAAENFAQGAYCVASTLHFLSEKIFRESTWLPSFRISNAERKEFEADFGMFARPSRFAMTTSPILVLGECKSFNAFTIDDFSRAHFLANTFPGAVLCFATFREKLTPKEIKSLTTIVRRGRAYLSTGRIRNPVLILTGSELFTQFRWEREFYTIYGDRAQYARMAYIRSDIEELCSFTQEVHLGIESYYSWRDTKHLKRTVLKAAASPQPNSKS